MKIDWTVGFFLFHLQPHENNNKTVFLYKEYRFKNVKYMAIWKNFYVDEFFQLKYNSFVLMST